MPSSVITGDEAYAQAARANVEYLIGEQNTYLHGRMSFLVYHTIQMRAEWL